MKNVIIALGLALLVFSVAFSVNTSAGAIENYYKEHGNTNGSMVIMPAPGNYSANVSINKTENGTVINISTKHHTTEIVVTPEKVMNMIKNEENRSYIFKLLTNATVQNQTKEMIKNTIREQLMTNKSLLTQMIPKYKEIIQKGEVKNVSVMNMGNQTKIVVKVQEEKKLFGFIPVTVDEEIIANQTSAEIKQPWWAIFAI